MPPTEMLGDLAGGELLPLLPSDILVDFPDSSLGMPLQDKFMPPSPGQFQRDAPADAPALPSWHNSTILVRQTVGLLTFLDLSA